MFAVERKQTRKDFRKIAQEMHDGFVTFTEGIRDDIRVFGEKQNEFDEKLNDFGHQLSEVKVEVSFIKRYLKDNLDPRISKVESRYSK